MDLDYQILVEWHHKVIEIAVNVEKSNCVSASSYDPKRR